MQSLLVLAATVSGAFAQKAHCPALKYVDGSGGSVSLLQKWKGVVLSTPLGEGNLTQATMEASFNYTASSDTVTADITYTDSALTPSSCSGHFEIGCIASTPTDYTFKFVSGDPCFTQSTLASQPNPWKCGAMLTGDDYQTEHHFAFGMEFRYDTDPASAPYALRGAPLGTFFSGCGANAWSQRALQYRLEAAN